MSSDEMDHYSVKRYESFGIPQEEFVRTIMPNFRYSLYVTKAAVARDDGAHAVVGRPNVSVESIFGKDLLAKQVRISDRRAVQVLPPECEVPGVVVYRVLTLCISIGSTNTRGAPHHRCELPPPLDEPIHSRAAGLQ